MERSCRTVGSTKRVFASVCLLAVVGCAKPGKDSSAEVDVKNFVQKLVLTVDGKPIELPLQKLDVFLTEEDEYPEIYEFHGSGIAFAGTFPKDVRVDYGEHWDKLVGKTIAISPEGGDPREPVQSSLTLPGGAPMKIVGGTFTVEKHGEGWDAKTPLTGRIEIKCAAPDGEKTYQGTFAVKGTTWG